MTDRTQQRLTIDTFRPLEGDEFRVLCDKETLPLHLTEVASRRTSDYQESPDRREPFALLFVDPTGSSSSFLPQGIYRLQHAELPETDIFIVPVGPRPDGTGMQYEALFN